jgi:hypothetical protein
VHLAARDRTGVAIAKPKTPFVRVDEFGDQISGNAWRAFHMDKSRLRARDRLRRLRASGGALFAFSATFEVCRDDRICRQGKCQNGGRERIP